MKPCPYCGCTDIAVVPMPRSGYRCHCELCGASGPGSDVQDRAKVLWGCRVAEGIVWCINEYTDDGGEVLRFTREQILESYFEHWKRNMVKAGLEHKINEESCIADWIVVNWAWMESAKPDGQ